MELMLLVIPAKAGIQESYAFLDSGCRRNHIERGFSDSLLGVEVTQYDDIALLVVQVHAEDQMSFSN
jgi:hypothetical protein